MNLVFSLSVFLLSILVFSDRTYSAQDHSEPAAIFPRVEVIDADKTSVNLGLGIEYYKDTDSQLSIETIRDRSSLNWQINTEKTPNFGVDANQYWFKKTIRFHQLQSTDYLLEIAYPALDNIDIYVVQDNTIKQSFQSGDHYIYDNRPINHRNFLFPLAPLTSDQDLDIYFKVQTSGALQVPIYVWEKQTFWEQDQLQLMAHTVFIAILLTIGLYNLMLFMSLRDTTYLLYVCYIGCLIITQMGLRGLNYQLLVPNSPFINERMLLVSIGLAVFFACLFASKFMSLKRNRPLFNKLLLIVAALALFQAVSGFFMPYAVNLKLGILFTALACPILLITGLVQWLSGYKVARFFTLAWVIYLIGQFAITLSKFGLIPRTTWVEYGPEIGGSIEVILLSFALADRMNEERRKRYAAQDNALLHEKNAREAQEQALAIQHKANDELEARVDARTLELRETLEELSYANEKLHSLSTMDGLTEVGNRRSFDKALNREWRRCAREEVPLSLILLDADHFKQVNDKYGHQAGDECLKSIAKSLCDSVKRPADAVARYGGEEFVIVLPNTPKEGALVIAERIRSLIEATVVECEQTKIALTVSIGLSSTIPIASEEESKFLEQADRALYRAKKEGRNRVVVAED